MSQILPINPVLDDVMELKPVDQTFTYTLTEEGAKFKSINITDYDSNSGITVVGPNYKGSYTGVFTFGGDALRYRKGDDLLTAGTWETLPPPREADLYLWRAPTNLRRTFKYTVTLIYDVTTPPEEPGGSGSTAEKKVIKTYTQDVVGNWSLWAQNLRAYVNAGK